MSGRITRGLAGAGLLAFGVLGPERLGLLVDLGREAGLAADLAGQLPGSFPFAHQRELWLFAFQAMLVLPGLLLLAVALVPSCPGPEGGEERLARAVAAHPAFAPAAALLAAALVAALTFGTLDRAPLTDDEHAYRIQAEILARGRLWLPAPADPDLWRTTFVFIEPGPDRYFTKYPLGWPLLLAPAAALGSVHLALPLLAGLLVLLVDRVGRRLYPGSLVAPLATVLFTLSPLMLATGATLASQPASLALLLLALAPFASDEDPGPLGVAAAGIALGLALHTRPLSAAALGLVLAGRVASRPGGPARLAALAAGAGPLVAAFLLYNASTTGSPWTTPMEKWSSLESYGFANSADPGLCHSPAKAVAATVTNLVRMEAWLTGWPGPLLLVLVGLLGPLSAADRLLAAWVGVHGALHAGYFFPGISITGPVYWFELAPALLLLALRGGAKVLEASADRPLGRPLAGRFLLLATLYVLLVVAPARRQQLAKLRDVSLAPYRPLLGPGPRPRVVALDFAAETSPGWKLGLSVMHPGLVPDGEPVLVRADAGPAALARLLELRGETSALVISGPVGATRARVWRPGSPWPPR